MNDETSSTINYKSNPLHGLSLKNLVTELVEHYGFDILQAYINLNCFKSNASIDSSVKFLKKTDWAREKVESFYLYEFKNLPRASNEQFELSPRDRVIPEGQVPGEPAELSIEDGERLQAKRAKKAAARGQGGSRSSSSRNTDSRSAGGKTNRGAGSKGVSSKGAGNRGSSRTDQSHSEGPSRSGDDPWGNWK